MRNKYKSIRIISVRIRRHPPNISKYPLFKMLKGPCHPPKQSYTKYSNYLYIYFKPHVSFYYLKEQKSSELLKL
jgi:hypothetical protein